MRLSLVDPKVEERINRLDLPFNREGLDAFGVSKRHLAVFFSALQPFYRRYFRVQVHGREHIPDRGRAILVGNHSGGLPVDAGMVVTSLFLDHEPPRLGHGMVDMFVQEWPVVSFWYQRCGQFPGLPDNAVRILEAERLLVVFPEGARGTGKLYRDRYRLVRFGTGFVRLALQTQSPIIPFAFIGGEEAIPTIYRARTLARMLGAPYVPITPYLVPFPLPRSCAIHFGEPMSFQGTGTESDEVIQGYVDQVVGRISGLIDRGLAERGVTLAREST